MPENTVDKPRYVVVEENQLIDLVRRVNKLVDEGYLPLFTVVVTETPDSGTWYYQTMWLGQEYLRNNL